MGPYSICANAFRSVSVALAAVAAVTCGIPARAAILLNEVLYDPEGADAGREWVELYNSGDVAVSLLDYVVERGNGSASDQWKQVWKAEEGDWIDAGGFFLVGQGTSNGASLDLQNGPDGVRLKRLGLVVDRVGWGELEYPEYYEGAPAEDVSSASLSRRSDGADTDQNERDFVGASPSPGRANFPAVDLSVVLRRPGRDLPIPSGRGEVRSELLVENVGSSTVELSQARFTLDGNRIETPLRGRLPPGERIRSPLWLPIETGSDREISWDVRVSVNGDANPDNDACRLAVRIGPGRVGFDELYPRPLSGESEWVELASTLPVDLDGWVFEDAAGTRLELGSIRVLPEHPAVIRESDGGEAGSWPSLNDRVGNDDVADTLFLRDPQGRICDWAAYGSGEVGESWRRVRGPQGPLGRVEWILDRLNPGGTPGQPNPPVEPEVVEPSKTTTIVSAHDENGGVWIQLPTEIAPAEYRIRVLDLTGRRLWEERGRIEDRSAAFCRWDGRTSAGLRCPRGLYLVDVQWVGAGGSGSESVSLVLDR